MKQAFIYLAIASFSTFAAIAADPAPAATGLKRLSETDMKEVRGGHSVNASVNENVDGQNISGTANGTVNGGNIDVSGHVTSKGKTHHYHIKTSNGHLVSYSVH